VFAATGDHLQLVAFDRNMSRLLTTHDVDASLYDVTVVDEVKDPTHGQ